MKLSMMLLTAAMAVMSAQPQRDFDAAKAHFALTDTQVQALQTIHQQERDATRSIFQEIRPKQEALRELMRNGTADSAAATKLLAEIEALRKQIAEKHAAFHDQAVNVLTAAQKTKLRELEVAQALQPAIHQSQALNLLTRPEPVAGMGRGMGMGRGHGGFGGPGGPRPMGGARSRQ